LHRIVKRPRGHYTARPFHTTADFAVPPLYFVVNRRKRKWLRSNPTILECDDAIGPLRIEGMAMRERDG
jgi:hypothetical protein